MICVPSLDWQLLQVEVYSGKNIFTRCSHQRPFSRYRQLAAYIYCARDDYGLTAYFLTFSKLKWITKEREFRFNKAKKSRQVMFFFLFTVHLQSLVLSMHSTWTLVPVSPNALTSFQQSDKKYENFNISRLYI